MKKIQHACAHGLGLNEQRVFSSRRGNTLIVGIRCELCGKITNKTEYASVYGAEQ